MDRATSQKFWKAVRAGTTIALIQSDPIRYDINATNSVGCTLLHFIVASGTESDVEQLLKLGADPNRQDRYGLSPLSMAIIFSNEEIARMLIWGGADLLSADPRGRNAIHFAAKYASPELLLVCLNTTYNATNTPDKYGDTPLRIAILRNNYEITCVLLEKLGLDMAELTSMNLFANSEGSTAAISAIQLRIDSLKLTEALKVIPIDDGGPKDAIQGPGQTRGNRR